MTQQPNHPWQTLATPPEDGVPVLVGWERQDLHETSAYILRGIWYGLGIAYASPEFWREMPPGPYEEPETEKLSCKDIDAAIRAVTPTQLPGLMIACIETGVDKGVWREYWIEMFAARIEREYRQKLSDDAEESHE